ncbi:phospholipase D-like domain-containing protein [Nitrosomonas sp.]|uniref:phospholipase D-like domain-containing protein n=1 Tax=Nitrosomonas sp. TaxID=42353 RepID=UPI001D43FC4F|nr:phospholipase D-like domain-containing protein [Nitrosomonas sp.]MBX3617950.1 phosphatidylserine/phosphatidylglycerophosphate/cardiolipin synthase family protein [Nitrosomonas sp.]
MTEVYFGGPDQPTGYLRNVLEAHIAAVPAGGSIDWATYYFRDLKLAEALIQARKRGVMVTVSLAGKPRTAYANDAVIAMLSGPEGLGDGLRIISFPGLPAPPGRAWAPQLHEKIYCFSHPEPIAFIGSFNPSGNRMEEQCDVIQEIGDQDKGYNTLIGLVDPVLVTQLIKHVRNLHKKPPGLLYRFSGDANEAIQSADTTIHFLPRIRSHPVMLFLSKISNNAHVRIFASHIRSEAAVNFMIRLANRGVKLEIFAEATYRRVTAKMEQRLLAAGIQFKRSRNAEELPMHLKLVLVKDCGQVWSIFGSFNWTNPSLWLNHEIAAVSNDPALYQVFSERCDWIEKRDFTMPVQIGLVTA